RLSRISSAGSRRTWAGAVACLLAAGCLPPGGAEHPWPAEATWATPGYGWPPRSERASEAFAQAGDAPAPLRWEQPVAVRSAPRGPEQTAPPSPALPESSECPDALAAAGVRFTRAEATPGVEVPVVLESPVGGVHYWASDRRPLLVDCRLGLALHRIGPVLRQHGIEKVRFSGAYVNRTTRRGRPSLHARGLAVDIHDWVVG